MKMSQQETMAVQAWADALLTPGGGGIAVWVRRDELMPRVALRMNTAKKEGETVDAAMIATLRIGCERITHAMADSMNMERAELAVMVAKAADVLRPHYQVQTNIVR
jgi:hypothetical protein